MIIRPFDPARARKGFVSSQSRKVSWFTWSRDARMVLNRLSDQLKQIKEPELLRLRSDDVTYYLSLTCVSDQALRQDILALAKGFYHFTVGREGIIFLRDIINREVNGYTIHVFLSVLCAVLPKVSRQQARYAPIAPADAKRSTFPLHADLFRSNLLLSIFDNVPSDPSGACLFLPTTALMRILKKLCSISSSVKKKIARLLIDRSGKDHYDEVFDLLHGPYPYTLQLERLLKASHLKIKLRTGEGYILDDRKWLHGRGPQSSDVESNRLYRLSFTNKQLTKHSNQRLLKRLLTAGGLTN